MAELTRGQKAAQTRARNLAAKAAEIEAEVAQIAASDSQVLTDKTGVPFNFIQQFLASIADIESTVFGDVQPGTVIITMIAGHSLTAQYDGYAWHLVL